MQATLKHFADSVPSTLAEKIKDIAHAVKEDFISSPTTGWNECYGCPHINDISGKSYDGFISFQNGGYEVTELFRCDMDASYHFTSGQTENMREYEKHMYDCFFSDNRAELEAAGLDASFSYSDLDALPDLQRAFEDYENEWYEPALLRFEIWVERAHRTETGEENRVFVRVSLNYRDAPYYRTKSDETLIEASFSAASILKHKPETLVKFLHTKMKDVK